MSEENCGSMCVPQKIHVHPFGCCPPTSLVHLLMEHRLSQGWGWTYLVSFLGIVVAREGGFVLRFFADFSFLQIELPFCFEVKPVLLVL